MLKGKNERAMQTPYALCSHNSALLQHRDSGMLFPLCLLHLTVEVMVNDVQCGLQLPI